MVLSPEPQISSSCSSHLHILCGGIDWSRQSSFSWWSRTAIVTRTPLISSFWVWIAFKWGEMKASAAQICYYSWYFLVYRMLALILFDSFENYCFYFLIWQSGMHCFFLGLFKKPLPPPFSQLLPHRKRTQTYCTVISMYKLNFSLGGFSGAGYKWADKQHFITYSSAKDLQNKLRSERRIRVRLIWRASVALQSILDFLQVHTCNLSSVVLVRGGFPESVTEMGML